MQALARELNLSETVFVLPSEQGGHAKIRIFTPVRELPFAGHPVLGTAFVLAAPLSCAEIQLETARGPIPVRLDREGARVTFGWMRQPTPTVEPFVEPAALLQALGVPDSKLPIVAYDHGTAHVLVALEPHQRWVLAELTGERGRPVVLHPETEFTDLHEAERVIYRMRWKAITGEELPLE